MPTSRFVCWVKADGPGEYPGPSFASHTGRRSSLNSEAPTALSPMFRTVPGLPPGYLVMKTLPNRDVGR